jgi:hypothetical protein
MTSGWNCRVGAGKTRRRTASGGKWNSNRTALKPAPRRYSPWIRKIGGPSWSGVLRSYVDFRETTREAESYEKYRAPLVSWWEALTEGFRRCRLVVERIQQRLDDVVAWFANALSPMLAVVVACRGDQFLTEMIYAGTKRWNQKHYALLKQRKKVVTPYVLRSQTTDITWCTSVPVRM